MKKHGGPVLNAEEQFVFIEDIAIPVDENDNIGHISTTKTDKKSNRKPEIPNPSLKEGKS
jgi:hypothetical protein